MKLDRIAVIAVLAHILSSQTGATFGTVNFLGQSAEHEKITRWALKDFSIGAKTMDEIAGRPGRFGAVGAPDRPGKGLLFASEAHCDNGDRLALPSYPQSANTASQNLRACRRWIFGQLNAAVRHAGDIIDRTGKVSSARTGKRATCRIDGHRDSGKCKVLEAMGLALHTAQDFYSHTNWTDSATDTGANLKVPLV